jgi:hypothetical protein
VTVAVTDALTTVVAAMNVALVEPAGMTTLPGTVTAGLLLLRLTVVPPKGALLLMATVPTEGWPPFTDDELNVRLERLSGTVTVNTWDPLVPREVVTVTLRGPAAAAALIVKVAVVALELETETSLTVISLPAETVMPAAKFVPTRVTLTIVPRSPVLGLTDTSVGGGLEVCVIVNV